MQILCVGGGKSVDITQIVSSITWSGDYQQAARKLEIDIAASPTDYYLPRVTILPGNMLKLIADDGAELFQGYVFYKEKSITGNALSVTAYDGLIYLTKSTGTYNFKKMAAEAITKKVAADFGITVGALASTGIVQSFIADGESIYDIIMQAYTGAAKQNGKKYMPIMQQGKLNIIEKGQVVAGYTLSPEQNITDATYSESIEDMKNRIRIYDENKNLIGTVENSEWVKAYGVLQDVYTKEQDKDAQTVAKNMLKGIGQTASISALGNTRCITGTAVQVKEPYTGLSGLFYIDSDTHTWQDGQHTMELGLSFKNIMDKKKTQEVEQASSEQGSNPFADLETYQLPPSGHRETEGIL